MLDQQDQQFIQKTLEDALKKTESNIVEAVGTVLEQNVLPQFDSIRAEMVTKEYLDDKLADLRGDLVVLTRKEDAKLKELVSVLREKDILNDPDVKRILTMAPFPQLIL